MHDKNKANIIENLLLNGFSIILIALIKSNTSKNPIAKYALKGVEWLINVNFEIIEGIPNIIQNAKNAYTINIKINDKSFLFFLSIK